jgi:hypothetical protein
MRLFRARRWLCASLDERAAEAHRLAAVAHLDVEGT